jgi:hypothetical protein
MYFFFTNLTLKKNKNQPTFIMLDTLQKWIQHNQLHPIDTYELSHNYRTVQIVSSNFNYFLNMKLSFKSEHLI